jgi:hypothetical protein
MTIAVKRSDLAWMLGATIPHVGKPAQFACVGLTVEGGQLLAYATDGYTAAIARAALLRDANGEPFDLRIGARPSLQASSDASDLLRYVRPNTVGDRDREVALLHQGAELHVGLDDDDSQVFDAAHGELRLSAVRRLIASVDAMATEYGEGCVYSPALAGKFASAQRAASDRAVEFPKRTVNGIVSAKLLTIGANFVGAVAGMTRDDSINPIEVVASLLQLDDLPPREEAA